MAAQNIRRRRSRLRRRPHHSGFADKPCDVGKEGCPGHQTRRPPKAPVTRCQQTVLRQAMSSSRWPPNVAMTNERPQAMNLRATPAHTNHHGTSRSEGADSGCQARATESKAATMIGSKHRIKIPFDPFLRPIGLGLLPPAFARALKTCHAHNQTRRRLPEPLPNFRSDDCSTSRSRLRRVEAGPWPPIFGVSTTARAAAGRTRQLSRRLRRYAPLPMSRYRPKERPAADSGRRYKSGDTRQDRLRSSCPPAVC